MSQQAGLSGRWAGWGDLQCFQEGLIAERASPQRNAGISQPGQQSPHRPGLDLAENGDSTMVTKNVVWFKPTHTVVGDSQEYFEMRCSQKTGVAIDN